MKKIIGVSVVAFSLWAATLSQAQDVSVKLLESTDGKTFQTLVVINCPKDVKADRVIVETVYSMMMKINDKDIPLVRVQTDVAGYVAGVEYGIATLQMPKALVRKVTVTLVADVSKTTIENTETK